ncbi:SIR2 family protein [Agrococcus sp. TF02-05]|uniref:SIR2 family protein n=1 Tax=Agrococcus sp. TF02-05 TaxID=2815211 RepID=UPI001AA140C9|nr:SIR2 family protein [Agrococcus sp. TF02-05]MBO1769902.1 SIR2 family protein [Agrococcus sp. TF02-05]
MSAHDVVSFINGLSEKLASRSRHVCMFLGAGASKACGLPDVAGLTEHVRGSLTGSQLDTFERLASGRNLEQVLGRLRRIAALLESVGDTVDGMTGEAARALDLEVCRLIIERLTAHSDTPGPMLRLASWAARADYHRPVELFTVNYDLLVETALEALGVPYFDGFVGTFGARFRADLVEADGDSGRAAQLASSSLPPFLIRLWKLHGSVHWSWTDGDHPSVLRLGTAAPSGQPAAIYPSDAKYDESRRVPFLVLQDRLRQALNEPETLTLVAGYAFGDQHLNEMIFDAARRRQRSEIVAFCYSSIPDEVANVASTVPNLQVVTRHEAILGGLRQGWRSAETVPTDVWNDGEFLLGDFNFLTRFMARSAPPRGELESRLAELLAKAAATNE